MRKLGGGCDGLVCLIHASGRARARGAEDRLADEVLNGLGDQRDGREHAAEKRERLERRHVVLGGTFEKEEPNSLRSCEHQLCKRHE